MQPLVSSEDARQLDAAVQATGVDVECLMEIAGARLWQEWKDLLGPGADFRLLFVAGTGHNGGDALVAARYAWAEGFKSVRVWLPDAPLQPLTERQAAVLRAWGVPLFRDGALESLVNDADAILEGLTGTGILKESLAEAADVLRRTDVPLYAVDLPAGTRTGEPLECEAVFTFAPLKKDLFVPTVRRASGKLRLIPLPWEPRLAAEAGKASQTALLDDKDLQIKRWGPFAHKGDRGRVGIVAGGPGMLGAGAMAALAAAVPAGVVEWCVPVGCGTSAASQVLGPLVWEGLSDEAWLEKAARWQALLIGPGMDPAEAAHYVQLSASLNLPVVCDAGALSLEALRSPRKALGVATPHPGELARLLEWDIGRILADPEAALEAVGSPWAVVVLKSQPVWIRQPDGHFLVADSANPGLAFGGSGDILSGLTAGLLASQTAQQAAPSAVLLHQKAGAVLAATDWPSPKTLLDYLRQIYGGLQHG